ncbi:MAG: hypothetical protein DRJ43_06495, partial [Thermoprotei archaeon]
MGKVAEELRSFFEPSSIAVVGASRHVNKAGHVIFKNLLSSKVKVYPVNPKAKNVLGVKCYKSIIELKGKVSHAVIAVPSVIVPQVVEECGIAGVKTLIIISAGFSESGNKDLENKIVSIAKSHGMRLLGPNVLGLIVPDEFNASFFTGRINSGHISFISQSGALGVGVLDSFSSEGWGLRCFISVGNTSDITITDALNEVLSDEKTKCIIIYAESLKDGKGFMKACLNSNKPVFILKAGTSRA